MADAIKIPENLKELFAEGYGSKFGAVPEGAPFLEKIGRKIYGSDAAKARALKDVEDLIKGGMAPSDAIAKVSDVYAGFASEPFSSKGSMLGSVLRKADDGAIKSVDLSASPLSRSASIGAGSFKAKPGAALGTALNTGMGLAGIFDNDKFGGQLIGTAAGAAIPALMGMKLNPLIAYNVAVGAGNIGALFDNLRAKKAQQQANPYGREEYVR